jgi:hypothetical protein
VDALRSQLREFQGLWANCPQSEQDQQDYSRDVEEHELAIAHLEQLAENHLRDLLLTGELIGLGYRQAGSGAISLQTIAPIEWAFLSLDYETSIAADGKAEYRAVRFVHKDNAPDTKPQQDKKKKRTPPMRGIAIALEAACKRLEETKRRRPNCQEVFDFLANKDETGIIEDSTDDKVTWRTQKGTFKDTKRKTICNMLTSRYKKT